MRLITSAVLAIGFTWITVSASPVRSLNLDVRNNVPPSYETRLEGGYKETERGFDINQIISPREIGATFKKQILDWLNSAATKGAAQFGPNKWVMMHSGGTSTPPHCRPWGMMKTSKAKKKGDVEVKEYKVKLLCAKDSKKPMLCMTFLRRRSMRCNLDR